MIFNTLPGLFAAWIIGVIAFLSFTAPATTPPDFVVVIGFVFLGALIGVLYFGKLTPLFVAFMGGLQASWIVVYPVAGILWGVCVIGAALYGKTLGEMALDDFYEHAQTRLPGFTIAMLLNLLLIIGFSILIWFLFPIIPSAAQLAQWLPFKGLPV